MKSLNQYITEKLRISKSNNRSIDVDVDPKVEKAVKKIISEMSSTLMFTNGAVKNFYETTRKVSTPGLRFFKWDDYYDMTSGKNHRDLNQNESTKYYRENGQIVVTDNDNRRIAGLMFVHSLNCQFLDMKEDTYLVILSSDPVILDREAYREIVLRAIEDNEIDDFKSILYGKPITFEGHDIKDTYVVPYEFYNKILNN